jgi:hypothetical protein
MRLAKAAGESNSRYRLRPNLWGLAGLCAGEERYIKSDDVSAQMKSILPECDLIVGTEEEVHIAAGTEDTLEALNIIRSLSRAVIVLKRGPMGCVVYPEAIPGSLDKGIVGKGFPIEVYNVLGAGDSFMSGFLRGWLRGEDHAAGHLGQCRGLLRVTAPVFLKSDGGTAVFPEDGSPPGTAQDDDQPCALATTRPGSRINYWRWLSITASSLRTWLTGRRVARYFRVRGWQRRRAKSLRDEV